MKHQTSPMYRWIFKCILYIIISNGLAIPLFAQSRIPAQTANFLSVTGNLANGDSDAFQVVFFEVPDTITGPIYFAVYDAGLDDNQTDADPDQGNTGNWQFTLIGGAGTISGSGARKVTLTPAEANTGIVLGTISGTGNTAGTDQAWSYFGGVYPSQGEKIGNTYYFKVVATVSNGDKNAFQLDASYSSSGTPTGVTGIRAFAYAWTLALRDRGVVNQWLLYPFLPDNATGNMAIHNYDFDGPTNADTLTLRAKSGYVLANPTQSGGAAAFPADVATSLYDITTVETNSGQNQRNGTWILGITEDGVVGGDPAINTSLVFASNSADATWSEGVDTAYRIYASSYTPAAADRVSFSPASGSAVTGTSIPVTLQIVDASGNPVPYVRDVYVTVNGSATITPNANGTAQTELLTTDAGGIASLSISDTVAETVTLTVYWNGTGGSDTFPDFQTPGSGTGTFTFQADLPPTISSASNLSFFSNAAAPVYFPVITIADSGAANITAANDIRIRPGSGLTAPFLTSVTIPTLSVGGVGTGTVNGAVSYTGGVLIINVTNDFGVGNTLTIGGATSLQVDTTADAPSSGRLEMSVDGGITWTILDDKIVTVMDPNPTYTWDGSASTTWTDGANWAGGTAPSLNNGTENIIIPNGCPNYPVLPAVPWSINNLSVDSSATLTLGANNLTINGILSNNGILILSGAGRPSKNDTDSGTVRYTVAGGAVSDFSATDYFNLELNGAGTYTTSAALTVAGNLSVGNAGGILDLGANALSVVGAVSNNGTILLDGTQTVTLSSGNDTDSGTWNYDGAGGGTVRSFGATDYYNLIVSGTGTFSADGAVTMAGAFSVTNAGGEIDLQSFDFSVASTVSNNGTIRLDGTQTVTLSSGNDTYSGTWNYDGAGGGTVRSFGATDYYNLIVSGTGTFAANGDLSIAGNLEVQAGATLSMGTNALLVTGTTNAVAGAVGTIMSTSGTQTFGGNFTIGSLTASSATTSFGGATIVLSSFTHSGGTVQLTRNGAQALTTNNQSFNNLTITSVGTDTTTITGLLTVLGNLVVQANQTLAVGNNTLSVTGVTTNGGTITLGTQSATFGGLVTNTGGTLTGGSGTLNLNGGLSGGTLTASSGTTNVGGNLTLGSFTHNSGVVVFTGSSLLTSNGQRFYDLTIGAGATVTPQDAVVVNRHFVINNTGTYVHNGQSLTLGGTGGVAGNVTDSNGVKQNLGAVTVSTAAKTLTTSIVCSQLTVTSTLNKGGGNDISVSGALNVTGGTLDLNGGGTVTVGGNVTLGTLLNGAGSTLALNGGGIQVVRPNGQTLGAVSVSGGTLVRWSGTATTQGITIGTGTTFRLDSTVVPGAVTLNVSAGSTVTNSGAFELNAAGGVLTLQGTAGSANYGGNDISWSGQDLTVGNLVYGPLASLPNLTDVSLNGPVTFTNGVTADPGSSLAVGTTTLTLGAASTLNGTMTVGAGGTVAAGANAVTNGGTITFSGGGSALNCGAFTSTGTINNTGTNTITASGNVAISGTFNTPGNSTLVMTGAGTTLNASVQIGNLTTGGGATVTSLANLQLAGSLSLGTGTSLALGGFGATFTGSAAGAGTAQLNGGSGLVTVGGNFTVPDYIATSGITRIGGTTVTFTTLVHSGGTIDLNGTGTPVTLTTGNQTFNNLTITTGAGPETVNVSGTLTVVGSLTVAAGHTLAVGNNTLSVTGVTTNGGTITLGTQSATFGGLVTNTGGTLTGGSGTLSLNGGLSGGTLTASSGTTNVGGNLTLGSFTHNSGVVVFTGSSLLTSNGQRFYDLTIGAGATVTPQDAVVVNRHFVINNTGTYVHNGQSLTLGGTGGVAGNVTDSNGVKQNLGAVTVSTAAKTLTTSIVCSQLTVTSTLNKGGGNDISVSGALNVTGGTLDLNGGGTVTVGGNVTLGTLLNGAGSTLALNGGGIQVVRPNGQTLGAVSVSGGTLVRWSGTATTQGITIGTGTTFRLDSTVVPGAVTLNVSAGSTVTNSGAFELNAAGGVLTLQGTAGSANYGGNDISWSGQDLTVGNLVYGPLASLPNLTDVSLNGPVTFTNGVTADPGSSLAVGTTTLTLGAASTLNGTMTVGAGGTVAAGANAVTNGGTITFSGGGSALNCGAFTSTGTINNTGTNTITASGNVAISGTFNTPGNSTLVMTGAGTTLNASVQIGNLTTGGGATVTSLANLSIAGNLEVQTGATLSMGTNDLSVTGTTNAVAGAVGTIMSTSGTQTFEGNFTIGSLTASSATTSFRGATVTLSTFIHNGGTVQLTRNGAQTLTTNNQSFNNLTITNVGTDTTTITGSLTVLGNLVVQANQTLAVGNNTLSVTGVTTNGGTITLGNQSATFGGLVTNTGTLTGGSGTLNLNGGLSGGTLTASSGTTNVGGNLTLGSFTHNSGVVVFTRNGAQALTTNNQSFNNLTITNVGTDTTTITGSLTVLGNLEVQANQTLSMGTNTLSVMGTTNAVAGSVGTIMSTSGTQTFEGNFTIGSLTASSATTSFRGATVTLSTFIHNGGTVQLTRNGAQALTTNNQVFNNLTITNVGADTITVIGAMNVTGTLSIGSNQTLDISSNDFIINEIDYTDDTSVLRLTGTQTTHNITTLDTAAGIIEYYGANGTVFATGFGGGIGNDYPSLRIAAGSGTKTLEGDIYVHRDVVIQGGTLDVSTNSYTITVDGNWTNNVGFTGFDSQSGTVIFNKASGTVQISGSNVWYVFECQVPGLTILFENAATPVIQRIKTGGVFRVRGALGNIITLDRITNTGIPNNPPDPGDDNKFWFFELIPGASLDMEYVDVYYSNARNYPVSVPPNVHATPYTTYYCYKWLDNWYAIYSYTEDADYNGKIDRIRVECEGAIGNDFSGFRAEVKNSATGEFYEVTGYSRPEPGPNFYIHLQEKPYLDGGAVLLWRVVSNTTLMDGTVGYKKVGNLGSSNLLLIDTTDADFGDWMQTGDTTWPVVAYTLALPGHSEGFIRFSEPVVTSGGGTPVFGDLGYSGSLTVVTGSGNGILEALGGLSTPTASTIASGTNLTITGTLKDMGDEPYWEAGYGGQVIGAPDPSYPPATGYTNNPGSYTRYATRPNFELQGGAGKTTHRISDVLISVPPANATDDRYFVWPIWARDSVTTEVPESQYESSFPTGSEAASQTIGLVRDFTGTQWLRDQDITLQVRVNPALTPGNLSLHFDSNVASSFRATSANGSVGLWLPAFNNGSSSGAAFSGIVPWPNDATHGGGTSLYGGVLQGTGPLWNFSIPASDPRVRSVSTLDFFFTLDAGGNADNPLYVARLDVAPGAAIPSNWYRLVRPFSFDIHDVTKQRSNATILNNVIDPTKGERVRLSYQLTKAGQVTIQVFTLDGDLVQVLYRGYRQAGDYTASWDGKNRGGRVVARGMYFIRIVGPDIDEIRKVMVVKE